MNTAERLHAIREGAQIAVAAAEMGLLHGDAAKVVPVLTEIIAVLESVRADAKEAA